MDKATVLWCVDKVHAMGDRQVGSDAGSVLSNALALIRREIMHDVEQMLRESVTDTSYCGSCGEWLGGPLLCCHEYHVLPYVSELDSFPIRAARDAKKKAK